MQIANCKISIAKCDLHSSWVTKFVQSIAFELGVTISTNLLKPYKTND